MTLEQLRVKLVAAMSGTAIVQVVFDYSSIMNLNGKSKIYPMALWDFDNLEGQESLIQSGDDLWTFNCWGVASITPEADVVNRHTAWDSLRTAMRAYLLEVNGDDDLTIENIRAVPTENFPAGLLSLEREIGVRYRIQLKLWC